MSGQRPARRRNFTSTPEFDNFGTSAADRPREAMTGSFVTDLTIVLKGSFADNYLAEEAT
jgi:hypothetical protein